MEIILSKQCESLTGSLGQGFGYFIVNRKGRFYSVRSKPEHSTGCVLMSAFGLNSVNSYINNIQKYYDNEEISIRIIDAR